MKALNALMTRIAKVEFTLVAIMIAIMAIVNFLQVVFRYVIQGSLPWSEELLRFLFVWTTFLGASIGVRKGAHLGLSALVDLLPRGPRKIINLIVFAICAGFCGLIAALGYSVVAMQIAYNVRSSAMAIPMWWGTIIIPISFIIMILHLVNIFLGNKDPDAARIEN